jgi:hypothetical protein
MEEMLSLYPSLPAYHSDFFNTHACLQQLTSSLPVIQTERSNNSAGAPTRAQQQVEHDGFSRAGAVGARDNMGSDVDYVDLIR